MMVPLAEALTILLRARPLLARSEGHRAYQEVRDAALTVQRAAHNGGVKPEMVRQLKEAIERLPGQE
jgi:hypothetical protein